MDESQIEMRIQQALKDAYEGACRVALGVTNETSPHPATLTAAKIDEMVALLTRLQDCEPFARFMRKHGCDPKDGWVMFLPESHRYRFGSELPTYVRYQLISEDVVFAQENIPNLEYFAPAK